MADAAATVSSSAKRRAAKKARDAAGYPEGEAAAPVAPAPEPKAKAKAAAKAETPAPKAKAAAKAEAKASPKAAAAPEPKAKAKAKAKAEAKAAAAPELAKAEPKAKAEAKAKAKAEAKPAAKSKAKAKPAEVEEEAKPKKTEQLQPVEIDDGKGGDWEVSSGLTKKAQKRQERQDMDKAMGVARSTGGAIIQQQYIPGMGPSGPAAAKGKGGGKGMASQDPNVIAAAAFVDKQMKLLEASGAAATTTDTNAASAVVTVPEAKIGVVIGPKGATIKMIQEKTGVTRIDTAGNIFTITGPANAVGLAEQAINDLIAKGYTQLAFDDFEENSVNVHPSSFPDLIGKQGAVIIAIKTALKVEINMPALPKGEGKGEGKGKTSLKKYKVTIAGPKAAVEKAKEVINDICMYYHHEITHPGQVHEELEIGNWQYSYVIGKGGCEMKHIQNNFKVRMFIPRETSANQNVLIVGEAPDVTRAKAYVEKVIWNAENAPRGGGRGADGSAADGPQYDDEGPEEEWMKQYLVKR